MCVCDVYCVHKYTNITHTHRSCLNISYNRVVKLLFILLHNEIFLSFQFSRVCGKAAIAKPTALSWLLTHLYILRSRTWARRTLAPSCRWLGSCCEWPPYGQKLWHLMGSEVTRSQTDLTSCITTHPGETAYSFQTIERVVDYPSLGEGTDSIHTSQHAASLRKTLGYVCLLWVLAGLCEGCFFS